MKKLMIFLMKRSNLWRKNYAFCKQKKMRQQVSLCKPIPFMPKQFRQVNLRFTHVTVIMVGMKEYYLFIYLSAVKVPHLGCKRARSSQAENAAVQSQGFIDHMAFVTMEAENAKLNRKIESLKQKLSNSLRNHEELKQELQTFK